MWKVQIVLMGEEVNEFVGGGVVSYCKGVIVAL